MKRFLLVLVVAASTTGALAAERPRLYTNETYVEDVTRKATAPLADPKAMLAFVLENLPDRVRVYPTENYYYFYFYLDGIRYGGNIRLDAKDRDDGKIHFAYFAELAEWNEDNEVIYNLFGKDDGVTVEKLEPLLYRVTYGERSVVFALNDLSAVKPPPTALGPDDQFLGPIFDESAMRFFLVFNKRLKIFHYVLDETAGVPDQLIAVEFTDRIRIGRRTGYAFYRDHRLDRQILIGVFEGNSLANNYFDGPFDQLPDNFLTGDELRQAILQAEPGLDREMDRFGGSPDGASRYLIGPYMHYREAEDLRLFHRCATDPKIARDQYHACFVVDDASDWSKGPPPPRPLAKPPAKKPPAKKSR